MMEQKGRANLFFLGLAGNIMLFIGVLKKVLFLIQIFLQDGESTDSEPII